MYVSETIQFAKSGEKQGLMAVDDTAKFIGTYRRFKPHLLMFLAQIAYTFLYFITEASFNHGMNAYVYITYRHIVSALVMFPFAFFLERKIRPKLTVALFFEIFVLSLLGVSLTLNMYFTSLGFTSPTFVASMVNTIASLTFIIAVVLRLEALDLQNPRGIAKVLGTLVSLAGVTIMTLYKGPTLRNIWHPLIHLQGKTTIKEDWLKGSILTVASCITWSIWYIMQAFTLKRYPAQLSLTTWMSFVGAIQSAVFTAFVERKAATWTIGFNIDFWSTIYGGIVISGLVIFIQLWCTEEKGPVFVTMFNPLSTILVAVLAYFVFGEKLFTGSILGSIIVIIGLYLLLWGKEHDRVEIKPKEILEGPAFPLAAKDMREEPWCQGHQNFSFFGRSNDHDTLTLYKGSINKSPWRHHPPFRHLHGLRTNIQEDWLKGPVLAVGSCITWSAWYIMQVEKATKELMAERVGNYRRFKPHLLMVVTQIAYTLLYFITEASFNHGMNPFIYVTYRHLVAAIVMFPFAYFLERKIRPKLTMALLLEIFVLSFLGVGLPLNMYFASLRITSPTFVATMVNTIASLTFVIAVVLRLEVIDVGGPRGMAKVAGTLVSMAGVLTMTLYKGPIITSLWRYPPVRLHGSGKIQEDWLRGSVLLVASCVAWSAWYIMQAFTLKRYPAQLSLTTWMCFVGAVQSAIFTVCVEHKQAAWTIGFDIDLLSVVYGGVVASALVLFLQLWVTEEKGPVFVTMFNPLCTVLVAVLAYFIFGERLYLGSIVGGVIVIAGLYMLLWGKDRDKQDMKPGEQSISASEEPNKGTAKDMKEEP
ncbi:uncharacterized protein LOC127799143 [Diospyros lotus]|uniref:uncharacterized protein LOC127799143 n=1 Tax=Diospyros lotus TaxID=55363 RepID=UPI0022577458|nr:uncharacterized protein LOC127799143 [Diospyros lotus]